MALTLKDYRSMSRQEKADYFDTAKRLVQPTDAVSFVARNARMK